MNKKKILIVDDEINVCKSIRQAIICDEYKIDTALSGEEAVNMEKENQYDLVITDLMMPGISGMELLNFFKEQRPEINIIIVTGYPTIKTAVESVKLGAFDYLAKPFTPKELRSLVSRAFATQELNDQTAQSPKQPEMPEDLILMHGHTWIKREDMNSALVGIVYGFLKSIKIIAEIELPVVNKNLFQGEVCVRITDEAGQVHRVWSPLSGKVKDIHEELRMNPKILMENPYEEGWMFRIESPGLEEELRNLKKTE
ncbi:MAG: response regulator [Candidatus Aminicenantes bacterium]|nr:response regulator [Candidatus Aminicenantes bacterium]